MITHSYKKVFKKLDKSKLSELQTIKNPVVSVDLGDGTTKIEIGGDICLVHYNRQKEIDHSTQKLQKRFRTLRKQEKRARCIGLSNIFPENLNMFTNVKLLNEEGESNG